MGDIAIRVEGLGKRYSIGGLLNPDGIARYKSLRESLSAAAVTPLRVIRNRFGKRFAFEETAPDKIWALRNVSFEVKQGDIVGVVGRNGAGKSTLLKLLARITEPTVGQAEIHGRVGSLLEVGTGFHLELTGRENVFLNGAILGMKHADIVRQFDAIISFAEVERFIDTPVKHYSSGMYLRLAFAVAAHMETEVLLVDEVLAVGDHKFQEKCLGKMRDVAKEGRTVFLVSHSMSAIQRLCTRAIAFDAGNLVADSTPETVISGYIGGNIGDTYFEAPSKTKPTITRAELKLNEESLILQIDFSSPFQLAPPVLGFIMYNSFGAPVFGTNSRTDVLYPPPDSSNSGRFEVAIPVRNFRPDRYLFSLWLGDHFTDYEVQENILKFDLHSGVGGGLPVSENGNAYVQTDWEFTSLVHDRE